jgi:iron complex outermembrane receptor protein
VKNSKLSWHGMSVAAMTGSFLVVGPIQAQTGSTSGSDTQSGNESQTLETVIVTGTSKARVDLQTPLVATSISSDRLATLASNSAADILTTVPALKAEGGGGEVAANIFVAGLPSGGQYQFTPLEFNGMPIISSMGLNSSAPDVYYRTDLGVDRLEFVRGGVSNLFGGGGIGGVINFIDKTGSDTPESVVQLEGSDHNRVRAEFAARGPIATDLYYALSGFYRYDRGPLDSGFLTRGYQLRGNIKREFSSGEVKFYFQAIDDQDQFYGDIPLTSDGHKLARGNNGHEISTTETSALNSMSFMTPNGLFQTRVGDGVATRGGSGGVDFKKDFGEGWGLNGRANFASYHHTFALFAGGDNITNLPTTQAAFAQSYGYNPVNNGGAYTGTFTYADNGAPVPANYLLWGDRVTDRSRPLTTVTGEINITKSVMVNDWTHHFTLGGFFGHTSAGDYDISYSYVGDFANAPRLINVVVTNTATNAQTIVSRGGMVDAGLAYTNNHLTARRTAGYLADQMEVGNWVLDIGGRFEGLTGDVKRELNSTVTTDTTPNLSPRLAQVAWGNGQYLGGTVKPSAWAVAGGALYRLDDRHSLFVNASRGFFMPQLNTVQIDTHNDVQSFEAEIIKQSEAGFKFSGTRLSATIAAFYSTLLNRRNINLINGPTPGSAPSEVVNLISTRSYGAEGTFNIRLTNILSFESNATYEHDYYTEYTPVAACQACVGNFLQRQPNVLANAGLYFRHRGFDGAFYDSYTGRTFTSDLNNIELPSYHIFRLDLGYSYAFTRGDRVRLGLSVYNLFDNQAVSEGSPRQGTLQNVGQAYFIGRQVLPRRISARLSYDF